MFKNVLLSILIICSNTIIAPPAFCHPQPVAAGRSETRTGGLQQEIPALEQGSPAEAELASSDTHKYRISLGAGQYLRVLVEQKGIKITLSLLGPDGKPIAEQPSAYGRQGPVSASVLAGAAAACIAEVRSTENNAPAGRYEIRIESLREPTPKDMSRLAAERACWEARKLRSDSKEESQRAALEKYKESLAHWRDAADQREEANTLQSIGIIYRFLGDRENAVSYYEQALALQKTTGDRRGEGYTLNFIGLIHATYGEFNKALDYYNQALALWQGENDKLNQGETYNRIGGVYDGLGNLRNARDYYLQSLQLRQEVKDFNGEGQTLNNLGQLYDKLGESQNALDYYGRALPIVQQAKDLRSTAIVLSNIGYTYASLGDLENALNYLEQARSVYKQVHIPLTEATTIATIGSALALSGNFQEALKSYKEALEIQTKRNNSWGAAYTLVSMGQAHAALGDRQKAFESYEQALTRYEQIGDQQGRALALDKIAQLLASLGQWQDSFDNYKKALQLWREVGDRQGEATTLYGIARLEHDRGNLTEALENSEAAVSIIESLRSKVVSHQLRIMYLASVRDYYDLNIKTRMKLRKSHPSAEHDARAFEASEQSRARSLGELLNEAYGKISQKADVELLERKLFLRQEIDAKEQAHIRLLRGKSDAQQKAVSEKELSALIQKYQTLLDEIKTKSPSYAALTQPTPLTLKEIQQQVLDPDTLLLEYSLGDERSYLWAVTQTSITSYELPARKEIETLARSVYNLLTARQIESDKSPAQRQARVDRADIEYWRQAARLSKMLLGDVASQLRAKRLVIVSEGALQYVPFAALPAPADEAATRKDEKQSVKLNARALTPAPHPLVIDHEIISLPSASVLARMRRELAGRKPASKAIAVLADPVFDKDDIRFKSSKNKSSGQAEKPSSGNELSQSLKAFEKTRGGSELERLVYSETEAIEIIKLASSRNSFKALGFNANLATARSSDLAQYRIVHFATHGLINTQYPELSGIVLSLFNEQGGQQNGFLRLHDIYNLNLPAELVVLSACKTGLGKEIRGEGLIGLTRGFMYAGAARVMATLWNVNDTQTANLMRRFYRAVMIEGLPPAAALRKAQVEMLGNPPYFWAAFVLQGEWK